MNNMKTTYKKSLQLLFHLTGIACLLLALVSCEKDSSAPASDTIDYSDNRCWFENKQDATGKDVDLFYVVPTCIWDYTDSLGQTRHHMDIFSAEQRALTDPSIQLAKSVLADSCNFFSPYYRQISMDSWLTLDTALIEERFKLAYQDVADAFHYYMEHDNQGKPFILAGHSQGAKAIIELLKREMTPDISRKLIATYAIGYTVTPEELAGYSTLRPAQDSIDTGVLIGFNSVTRPDAVSPLFRDNVVCINPANWRTDATPATSYQGFTVAQDTTIHTLIVTGINEEQYFIPSVAALLPKGNLHVQEFNLYNEDLRKNVLQRIRAFRQAQ
ncbi:DUF3089 domain-containing protein [Bacteroides gallinaceum]|uniref:DUF3089 domain-containing protein n=1 Tax=Bacteroides gallinaceum TaxID=1462571 RepID=UPI0025AA9C0E|nr:DUF3089 domain-containing protein [Bacteroides gallinaceum]MDN0066471.1 DUF3089 domain-containing protein [Bacteroides gallinaceum]